MRQFLVAVLLLGCAALPVFSQTEYRINRSPAPQAQASQSASTDWVEDFQTPPPPAPGSAGFVMNINQTPNRHEPNLPLALPAAVQRGVDTFVKKLGARELSLLSSRDVVILVDKSSSMGDKDCPPPAGGMHLFPRNGEPEPDVSRWDWVEGEMINMSKVASSALRQGVRVVMFSGDQQVYEHVRLNQIPQIFDENYPTGSTNVAAAMKAQLDWYFQNRQAGRARPMVIAVITDGLPNNTRAVKKAIIEATHDMNRPDEIAISFLQVGRDRHGVNFVHEADDDLVRQGAVFDIVDCKDFAELLQTGLARSLADAINETSRGVARNDY